MMSCDLKQESLSRRQALKILAGSAGSAASLPILPETLRARAVQLARLASAAAAPAPKFFTTEQLETLRALSETIIPEDEHSPGARAAQVELYLDLVVADSAEDTKQLWRHGLAALDRLAEDEHGKKFVDCAPEQQASVVEKISQNEEHPTTLEESFFVAAKQATVEGYYTSKIGIHQELEYQGNTALADFPGCAHSEHEGSPQSVDNGD